MKHLLRVNETFVSIQGESTHSGRPCFFIRLTGCNLRCSYCDTSYAWYEGEDTELEKLVQMVRGSGMPLVEVTGGEPMLQKNTPLLVEMLCDEGFEVLVETNGSQDISLLDSRATVVLDIKTPGSGMFDAMDLKNINRLKVKDEVKFVITSEDDYSWAKEFIKNHGLSGPRVLFSPAWRFIEPELLSRWILRDRLDVRLNLQLHKYIFGERRGV